MNFAFLSVEECSSRAEEIYKQAKKTIDEQDKNSILPGLLDQYQLQLDRLRPGEGPAGPGCELIMSPGIAAAARKCLIFASTAQKSDDVNCTEPLPSGKKYVSICAGLNHTFSRGTIVSI